MKWFKLYGDFIGEGIKVSHTRLGTYYVSFSHQYGSAIASWGMLSEGKEICYEEFVDDFEFEDDALPEMLSLAEKDFLDRTGTPENNRCSFCHSVEDKEYLEYDLSCGAKMILSINGDSSCFSLKEIKDGELIDESCHKINFCPICGAKLNKPV